MRSDEEMYQIILDTAKQDDRIHGVILNGSRANPKAPKDRFRDFDIVYVVDKTEPFIEDKDWINRFGEKLVFQLPDELDALLGKETDISNHFTWLMQFIDGTRIDLTVETMEYAINNAESDSLSEILLNKNGVLPPLGVANDRDYWVKRPTADEFYACCNEYWWVSLYAAKGLCRGEILFALEHMNKYIRPQLLKLLSWHAGMRNDFSISVGKCGKYLESYVGADIYERYLASYTSADTEKCWRAVFTMDELFYELERGIAKKLGFIHDAREAENSMWHKRKMKMGIV